MTLRLADSMAPVAFHSPITGWGGSESQPPPALVALAEGLDGCCGTVRAIERWILDAAPGGIVEAIAADDGGRRPGCGELRFRFPGGGSWRLLRFRPAPGPMAICRLCGCSNDIGCVGGLCSWTEHSPDLCSRCAGSGAA